MTAPIQSRRKRRGSPWPIERRRPGLVRYVLDRLASAYGRPTWRRRNDPTTELILTILSQNSADVNAERAFESLRTRFPPAGPSAERPGPGQDPQTSQPGADPLRDGWGGRGITPGSPPNWQQVEQAPLPVLTEAIRPGGLAVQKAPRIQAALRSLREARGDYGLDFLGELPASEARAWLTSIAGIGPKTASVVLLFSFGMPLMPVDRHVERVAKRIGLIQPRKTADEAHELFLAMLAPEDVYEAHVNLIHHGRVICQARNPRHDLCPVAARCRFVNPRAA